MENVLKSTTIWLLMFLLLMVTNAMELDDTIFDSKDGSFISKGSSNQRIVRDTEAINIEGDDLEFQTDMRHLTKRNLRALQNTISRVTEAVENLEQKICQTQLDENSNVTELIEKNAVTLDRIEKEVQKHHTEVETQIIRTPDLQLLQDNIYHSILSHLNQKEENYKSIFDKVNNLETQIIKKPDLQSLQDNILYSLQPQLEPSGRYTDCTKSDPKISKKNLLNYLKSIPSSRIISGINIFAHSQLSSGKLVHEMTGIHPGIWSATKNHFPEWIIKWDSYIDEAISQWNNNSLINLQWFPCPPTSIEGCYGEEMNGRRYNVTQWNDLVTDGGHLNLLWKIRLNSMVVPFLKRLESAGVIVIFDPLPLMNFENWWGTGTLAEISGTRGLYQITRDYLTKEHNLNSIIWRWSVLPTPDLQTDMEQLWPGTEYVDVVSVNMWNLREPSTSAYEKMVEIAGDMPMSMEWMYAVPTAELLKRQPRWTWFTVEDIMLKNPAWNNVTNVQVAFENHSVINRDGIEIFKQTNFALKGRATASSIQSVDVNEEKAIDGNNATRWSSEFSDPQWLQIDLGQLRFVKMIKIFWEKAFATGYHIQTSENKIEWTVVHEEYHGAGELDEISIKSPQLVRYVKMFGFKRGSGYGYSIFELEVY